MGPLPANLLERVEFICHLDGPNGHSRWPHEFALGHPEHLKCQSVAKTRIQEVGYYTPGWKIRDGRVAGHFPGDERLDVDFWEWPRRFAIQLGYREFKILWVDGCEESNTAMDGDSETFFQVVFSKEKTWNENEGKIVRLLRRNQHLQTLRFLSRTFDASCIS